jgi:signal transduction histidine kinase
VYICLIFLALYNTFHSYQNNISQAKQTVFAKLSTISNLLAKQINGDLHEKLITQYKNQDDIKTSSQDADYKSLHHILAQAQTAAGIRTPIYTLFPANDFKKFFFGVTSSENPYYKHLYHTPPKELIADYEKGGFIDEYIDENGIWLSSFAPIKNKAGKVVAIIQVDQNFEEFMIEVNKKLIGNISFIALIYSVIGFLLYLFLKEVLQKEEVYSLTQQKYKQELEEQVNHRTKELSVVNKKLVDVNKELESFFYSTSHDIRGPLCRILGLSSLAKSEDDKQELVEMIEIESQKMDNMLKKMILVNNLRTKELKIEPVFVCDTVNTVLSKIKKKYHQSKAEVVIKTETQTLKQFNSDTQIIESIICNLLDNAFKFSDGINPKIAISSFIDKNGILSLTVANNGLEFTAKEMKHAFELFKNASLKDGDADGIRLGLYTIKTALDKLNGVIEINTNVQNMTEIKVLIPDFYIGHKIELLIANDQIIIA